MRIALFLPLLALIVAACNKKPPMPEEALAEFEKSAADCQKCLNLVPEKAGPCIGEAAARQTKAAAAFTLGTANYDEKSVARHDAADKLFQLCRNRGR